ncbi:MAG TPA: ATP-binding protein, partial [Methylomirabilota bacterium]|nr:ATP-binding protein [Methylomirabilota bacterium]
MNDPEIQKAFAEYDRRDSIHNSKVGCLLAIVLMPLGSFSMDYFMYREQHLWDFFLLRLASSVLTIVVLGLLMSRKAERYYRALRMAWYWIPMLFIACLIYAAKDPTSPYYAGFNLVLVTVGVVLPWTYREILATSLLIISAYVGISLHSGWGHNPYLANNLFFLGCTALIVVTGSYFHSRLRFREFSLRFELERNRKIIEENNRKLVELDAVKSRFFANISHELRTPLTLLLAPLEALLRRFNLDQESRNLLGTMHSNGMRLLKLINDLLDLVRLESGRMEVKSEPLEVAEFIKGLASATRQVADGKRLRLETIVDPDLGVILADRDKLEKVLLNLVFNALKFTPAGGRVEIRAQKETGEVVLTVADTGMGIAAANLPYVFDRFWQADGSSKRKFQGVGIGLSLVKELVEIQGGQVKVESVEGRGTTFTVRLPYQAGKIAAETPPTVPEQVDAETDGTVTSEEWLANLYRRAELFPAVAPVQDLSSAPVETNRNGHLPALLIADDEPDMLRFL